MSSVDEHEQTVRNLFDELGNGERGIVDNLLALRQAGVIPTPPAHTAR